MKILIAGATIEEIDPLKGINPVNHDLDFLITGVGMVASTYSLTKYLNNKKYDLAISCGIAGSFDRSILIGEVVSVIEDAFSELGAEDGNEFLSLSKIGIEGKFFYQNTFSLMPFKTNPLREVRGISVNTIHGNESSIQSIINRLQPHIETMEGASFFHVCEKENLPSLQLRAISNYIERRNKNAWNIPLALENLNITLEKLLFNL